MAFTDTVRALTVAALDISSYDASARRLADISSDLDSKVKSIGGSGAGGTALLERGFVGVATAATAAVAAIIAVGGAVAASTLGAAGEMDSLKRALAAVTDGAAGMSAEMGKLEEIAKLPGLGFREAIEGVVRLRNAGLSMDLANRSLSEFGNAIALAGGGKANLDAVTLALTHAASEGKLMGRQMLELLINVPQVGGVMRKAFGTSNTEELAKMGLTIDQVLTKILDGLSTLPRMTGGLKNAMENLDDAMFRAKAAVGTGLFSAFGTSIDGLASSITRLAKDGSLERWGRALGYALRGVAEIIPLIGAGLAAWGAVEVVGGIVKLIGAIKDLRTMLEGVSIVEAVAEALAGNWVNIAAGAAAAVLVGGGLEFALRKLTGGAPDSAAPAQEGDTKAPEGGTPAIAGTSPWDVETARNTASTAENTRKTADQLRYIVGGGRNAIDPITIRGVVGPGRPARAASLNIRVTGAGPDEADRIQSLLADLARQGYIAPGPAFG